MLLRAVDGNGSQRWSLLDERGRAAGWKAWGLLITMVEGIPQEGSCVRLVDACLVRLDGCATSGDACVLGSGIVDIV